MQQVDSFFARSKVSSMSFLNEGVCQLWVCMFAWNLPISSMSASQGSRYDFKRSRWSVLASSSLASVVLEKCAVVACDRTKGISGLIADSSFLEETCRNNVFWIFLAFSPDL